MVRLFGICLESNRELFNMCSLFSVGEEESVASCQY